MVRLQFWFFLFLQLFSPGVCLAWGTALPGWHWVTGGKCIGDQAWLLVQKTWNIRILMGLFGLMRKEHTGERGFKFVKDCYREEANSLCPAETDFSPADWNCSRGCIQSVHRKKRPLVIRVGKLWERLPEETAKAPYWEVFKSKIEKKPVLL